MAGLNQISKLVDVKKDGLLVGTRKSINFSAGDGVSLVVSDDGSNDEIDIFIESTGGGSGAVDSVNGQTGTVVLTTAGIADSTNKRYVTDAHLTILGNTSGVNTGDQDLSGYLLSDTAADTYQPLGSYLDGSLTAGRIPFASDSNTLDDDSNIVWDDANKRAGIQVANPQAPLHVAAVVGETINPPSATVQLLNATDLTAPSGSASLIPEPAAGSGGSVSYTNGGSGNFWSANGSTLYFRIYPCLLAGSNYLKSQFYEEVSAGDPNDAQYYDLVVNWGAVSISGESVYYHVEWSSDGSSFSPLGLFSSTGETFTSPSGSDGTTAWPSFYTHAGATGPDAPVSFDSITQDGMGSGFTATGVSYQYEIDTYKDIGGTKYVSGAPVSIGATDDNSSNPFQWNLSWTLTGTYDGVIIRRSSDGGSTWEYLDLGATSSYTDNAFTDDGVSSGVWGSTYSGGSSTTFSFAPYITGLSPSGNSYYSPAGSTYTATISDSQRYVIKHTLSVANCKIVEQDTSTYGINIGGLTTYYDYGYTTWGNGPSVSPSTYGLTGTNQNRVYRLYSYKVIGSTTIYSSTYTQVSVSAAGGSKYVDLDWTLDAGVGGVKIFESINGGAYTSSSAQISSGTLTLQRDALGNPFSSSATVTPTTVTGSAVRFDRNSTAKTDAPIVEIVSYGSGLRYIKQSFGVANDPSSSPSYVAHLIAESATGYLEAITGRFDITPSIGGTPSVSLGNANIINNNQSSSSHFTVKGANDASLINTRSDQDTVGFGQAIGSDQQCTVQIQPARSSDAAIVLIGHSSMSNTSTLLRGQTSAGSYNFELTMGGWMRAATGAVSTPAFSCRSDTDTGLFFPTSNVLGFATGSVEAARFDSSGNLAIGLTSSISAKLDVYQTSLGSMVQRLQSQATNDDPVVATYQNRVATTNATVTTLQTLATTNNAIHMLEIRVTARRTGGTAGTANDCAAYKFLAAFKNAGGTVTQLGSTIKSLEAENQAAWDVTFAISGTNVLIQVTGAANNNITWHLSEAKWTSLNN